MIVSRAGWEHISVNIMDPQAKVVEGTAKQIREELRQLPDDIVVRLMVGRPSLSIIASRLQAEAAARGMTKEIHDDLISSLKNG